MDEYNEVVEELRKMEDAKVFENPDKCRETTKVLLGNIAHLKKENQKLVYEFTKEKNIDLERGILRMNDVICYLLEFTIEKNSTLTNEDKKFIKGLINVVMPVSNDIREYVDYGEMPNSAMSSVARDDQRSTTSTSTVDPSFRGTYTRGLLYENR
ncbi:uncharacterized protein LOC100178131 isoform X2 [Ciona intestinalis]